MAPKTKEAPPNFEELDLDDLEDAAPSADVELEEQQGADDNDGSKEDDDGLDALAEGIEVEDAAEKEPEEPPAKTKPVKGKAASKKEAPAAAKTKAKAKAEKTADEPAVGELVLRKLTELKPSKNLRQTKAQSDAELIASIKEVGLQTPLTILLDGTITDGNRRFHALQKLGVAEAPCYAVLGLDEIESGLAASLAREELNTHDTALAIAKLVKKYGDGGQAKVARLIGRGTTFVADSLAFLDADPDIKERVEKSGSKSKRKVVDAARKQKQRQKPKGAGRGAGRPRTQVILTPDDFGSVEGFEALTVYHDSVRVTMRFEIPVGKLKANYKWADDAAKTIAKFSAKNFVQVVNAARDDLPDSKEGEE